MLIKLFIFSFLFVSCQQDEMNIRFDLLKEKKKSTESFDDRDAYFKEITSFYELLKYDEKSLKKFRRALNKVDIDFLCDEILIDAALFSDLYKDCFYDGYPLCSKEMLNYPETLKKIYFEILNEDEQRRLSEEATCFGSKVKPYL